MDALDAGIFALLVMNPGHMYVSPDGKRIHIVADPEAGMLVIEGDFANMDADQLNAVIVNTLS